MRFAANRTGPLILRWRRVPLSVTFRIRPKPLALRMTSWLISARPITTVHLIPTLIRHKRNWTVVFARHSITCSTP
ncbi:hypothetical protein GTE46_003805 [Salmonella enterica subsp. enterica]|nr:hypothetical protein [Salmonella enterica subsp. enterica]EDY2802376.1 hypothetical protein [Salmonella enterica subsp. enterica]